MSKDLLDKDCGGSDLDGRGLDLNRLIQTSGGLSHGIIFKAPEREKVVYPDFNYKPQVVHDINSVFRCIVSLKETAQQFLSF